MVLRETKKKKNNKRLGGGDRKEKNRSKGIKSSPFDFQSLEGDVHFFPVGHLSWEDCARFLLWSVYEYVRVVYQKCEKTG